MARSPHTAFAVSFALLFVACRRPSQSAPDAAVIAVVPNDAGVVPDPYARTCPAEPPADGGLSWEPGVPASLVSLQNVAWTRVSNNEECSALAPAAPTSELTWAGPDGGGTCDPAVVNGTGDLAIYSLGGTSEGFNFVSSDGAQAQYAADSKTDRLVAVAPIATGFGIVRRVLTTECDYANLIGADVVPPTLIDGLRTSQVYQLVPNPLGGYVEVRTETITEQHPDSNYLTLRWVDESLKPRGDWHTAMTWPVMTENEWSVTVDQLGKAFMLSFNYPPTLGSPPVPTSWAFSARWMDIDGPISDLFTPIAPTYTAPDGRMYFASWDVIRPLNEGGVAVFHWLNPGTGTLSPSGWYAYYPSGHAGAVAPPAWLSNYDGSLALVANGQAYAALQRDPTTCARTVSLISLSGTICYELSLPHSDVCGVTDRIQADGTVILQAGCPVRWWPQAARLMP